MIAYSQLQLISIGVCIVVSLGEHVPVKSLI